ncbi:acetyl-CoA acetyltransferase [Palleronia aestuarii]|uniref:Acetyl-CoA acetyltransferase n=1 Tax=Palleronia aestuarii TaxID=568105 RepID=A0A2W7PU79_9RHOB|nr:thiolase family protein [Palleronia aestuarii]PZX13029.1 acetyl-CoA acetyltransferase [Palleronia aestuarii]
MASRAVIAGIGQTAFGRLPGRTTESLNIEACRKALEDAAIEKDRVDGLLVKVPTSRVEMMYGQKLAEAMGMQPRFGGVFDQGGASNISMIGIAAMAIEAGQCEIALVSLADNPKTGSRAAYEKPWGDAADLGWSSVVAGYALIARRYLHEFPNAEELFRDIAIAARAHGAENPNAQLRKPLDTATYEAANWIVEPLRRDDCCLISDGAAAVVVMSEARAKELDVRAPVPVLGIGQGNSSSDVTLRADLTKTRADVSAATAFAMAGLEPRDMDCAQIYDCFTVTVAMTLEAYGFGSFDALHELGRAGGFGVSGDLPINTSGGLLSETGMPGMQLVLEGVRQMRGDSVNQVENARKCVVSNQGGIMHTHSTLILGQ